METNTTSLVEGTNPTKLQRLAEKLSAMTDLKDNGSNPNSSQREHRHPRAMKRDPVWEDGIRDYIARSVPELNEIGSPDLIRSVYIAGVQNPEILKSLAALCLPNSREAQTNYDNHILTLAQCFSTPSPVPMRKNTKLAVLRTLITLRSPLEAGWQLQEDVLEDTLKFITTRSHDWPFESHYDEVLLWELRATTLNEIEMRSERVAGYISEKAVLVKRGLELSTDVVNAGIEGAGAKLKEVLKEDEQRMQYYETNPAILLYSEKAKLATDSARVTSRQALVQIQSTSARGIQTIATKINERGVERFIPHEQSRRALCDVGKVGMASVGAAALVADAMMESTGQVYKKTASVAADVVEHKYGPQAGLLVRNASDTVGNIGRTLGHVAFFHKGGRAMTKRLAKTTGKAHLIQINEKCLLDDFISESSSSDESDLFAEATGDIFDGEAKEATAVDKIEKDADKIEKDASDEASEEHSLPDAESDVFIIRDDAASDFDFGSAIIISPSELDTCLPDEITSAPDGHSDFFSDVTVEPMYERRQRSFPKLRRSSSRSSIFRYLNDSQEQDFLNSNAVEGDELCGKPLKSLSDDDESLDYTACTMEETYLTYGDSDYCPAHDLQIVEDSDPDDAATQVSGFEKHYETWGTGSVVSTTVPETNPVHRIPANGGYVDLKAQLQGSPGRGLYSSVKTSLGLQSRYGS